MSEEEKKVEAVVEESDESRKAEAFQMLKELMAHDEGKKILAHKLLKASANERPDSWNKLTVAPYYKEHFAKEVKIIADAMIEDGLDRELRYSDFSLSRRSLYNKINQGLRYLVRFMDPDGRYAKFDSMTVVTREATALQIRFVRDLDNVAKRAQRIQPKSETFKWKEDVENFIANSPMNKQLRIVDISLTDEDIEGLKASFVGIEGLRSRITPNSILIAKFDPETIAKMEQDLANATQQQEDDSPTPD